MACNDWPSETQQEREHYRDRACLQERCDKLARMLCEVLQYVKASHEELGETRFTQETEEWWRAHKEADRRREESERAHLEAVRIAAARQADREVLRNAVLAELTAFQRAALGF